MTIAQLGFKITGPLKIQERFL